MADDVIGTLRKEKSDLDRFRNHLFNQKDRLARYGSPMQWEKYRREALNKEREENQIYILASRRKKRAMIDDIIKGEIEAWSKEMVTLIDNVIEVYEIVVSDEKIVDTFANKNSVLDRNVMKWLDKLQRDNEKVTNKLRDYKSFWLKSQKKRSFPWLFAKYHHIVPRIFLDDLIKGEERFSHDIWKAISAISSAYIHQPVVFRR